MHFAKGIHKKNKQTQIVNASKLLFINVFVVDCIRNCVCTLKVYVKVCLNIVLSNI